MNSTGFSSGSLCSTVYRLYSTRDVVSGDQGLNNMKQIRSLSHSVMTGMRFPVINNSPQATNEPNNKILDISSKSKRFDKLEKWKNHKLKKDAENSIKLKCYLSIEISMYFNPFKLQCIEILNLAYYDKPIRDRIVLLQGS